MFKMEYKRTFYWIFCQEIQNFKKCDAGAVENSDKVDVWKYLIILTIGYILLWQVFKPKQPTQNFCTISTSNFSEVLIEINFGICSHTWFWHICCLLLGEECGQYFEHYFDGMTVNNDIQRMSHYFMIISPQKVNNVEYEWLYMWILCCPVKSWYRYYQPAICQSLKLA